MAKAYLNSGDYSLAWETINRTDLAGDHRSHPAWDANDICLKGRIRLAQLRHRSVDRPLGTKDLTEVEELLDEGFRKLAPMVGDARNRDIITRMLSLSGEVDLALRRPARIIQKGWERQNGQRITTLFECLTSSGKTPLDSTDAAWGWLVLAQAYIALEAVNKAKDAMGHYRSLNIENTLFESLAQRVDGEIKFKLTNTGLWFPPLPDKSKITLEALRDSGVGNFEETLRHWIVDQFQEREVLSRFTKDKLTKDVFDTSIHRFDTLFHPKPSAKVKKATPKGLDQKQGDRKPLARKASGTS